MDNAQLTELIVKQIEQALHGPEVHIKTRLRTYGESGFQTSEIDVVVTQPSGLFQTKIIGEVRDRRGPQGVDWIRDINSKKQQFGAHHAFAVSTDGFTGGAREIAALFGIQLRELNDIDTASEWFRNMNITFAERRPHWEFVGEPTRNILANRNVDFTDSDPVIQRGDKFVSVAQLVTDQVDEFLKKQPQPSLPTNLDIRLRRMHARIGAASAILSLSGTVHITDNGREIPLVFSCYRLSEAEGAIAINGRATVTDAQEPYIVSINGFLEGGIPVRMQSAIYNMNGELINYQDGYMPGHLPKSP